MVQIKKIKKNRQPIMKLNELYALTLLFSMLQISWLSNEHTNN